MTDQEGANTISTLNVKIVFVKPQPKANKFKPELLFNITEYKDKKPKAKTA